MPAVPAKRLSFAALQEGFFAKEGLDVQLVQMDFDQLKTGLATGKVDAAQAKFCLV